ncbi:hypothetical protein EfmAA94_31900 (plasmid) [Enterococcus faecium]|nr:hypothetical protein EfmAA94_31900 [Enterococcus faecium]
MKRKSYDRWGIEITSFNRMPCFNMSTTVLKTKRFCGSVELIEYSIGRPL